MEEFKILLEDIKNKFGSVSRFTDLAGYDYVEFNRTFARFRKGMNKDKEKELAKIRLKYKKTDPTKADSKCISEANIRSLGKALASRGGVQEFTLKNNKFNSVSIYQILDGRRKTKTKMIKELFETLNIKL